MNREDQEKELLLLRELRIRKSRESFWEYCRTMYPGFYKKDRHHLKKICDTLQGVYEGTLLRDNGEPYRKVILSIPPRHGKTFSKDLFVSWAIGKNPKTKIISAAYAKDLSIISSRTIRNKITEEKTNPIQISYSDVFPHIKISDDNASVQNWSVEGSFFTFKAVSIGSAVTGMGASILVADDLVADSMTANSELELDKIWDWFWNTYASRAEKNAITIVIGTMWSDNDHIGRILKSEDADEYCVIRMRAYDEENDEMLCDELLDKKQWETLKKNMDTGIFLANYQAKTLTQKGRLYQRFQEYDWETKPEFFDEIIAYVDTADTGKDYLAAFIAGTREGRGYILDTYVTQEPMEVTERELARKLIQHQVKRCRIESNNGGRGFARNVERIMWDEFKSRYTVIETFHQTKNKQSRILTYSSFVEKNIFFEDGWDKEHEEAFTQLRNYQRSGKNAHDDVPDALTGLCEFIEEQSELLDDFDRYDLGL